MTPEPSLPQPRWRPASAADLPALRRLADACAADVMRRDLRQPLPELLPAQGFVVLPWSAERVDDFYQSYYINANHPAAARLYRRLGFKLLNRRSVLLKPVQVPA